MKILLIVPAVLLCGCAGDPVAQRNQISMADDARCQSYGAKRGSEAYYHCRMKIDSDRTQAEAFQEGMARQGAYSTMMDTGFGMMTGRR